MARYEVTWREIAEGLRELGLERGSTVLVHSSLSSFGYVVGGAEAVIKALVEVVGEEGTVVVPTLTGSIRDCPENPPVFSPDKPCWTGRIPETLRRMPGAIRSLHPTHSVAALGAGAEDLVRGHERCWTPCGEGSPYVKLARGGGYILFLGVTLESNTTFHAAEELAQVRYHLQLEPVRCRIATPEGERTVECMIHAYGTPRAFADLEDELEREGILARGRIGRATVRLVRAGEMLDYTVKLLRGDELALVRRRSVDLWSLTEAIRIAGSEGATLRLLYYVPEGARVEVGGNRIRVSGVELRGLGPYVVESLTLRLDASVEPIVLEGGALHWIRISGGKRVRVEVLETVEL